MTIKHSDIEVNGSGVRVICTQYLLLYCQGIAILLRRIAVVHPLAEAVAHSVVHSADIVAGLGRIAVVGAEQLLKYCQRIAVHKNRPKMVSLHQSRNGKRGKKQR